MLVPNKSLFNLLICFEVSSSFPKPERHVFNLFLTDSGAEVVIVEQPEVKNGTEVDGDETEPYTAPTTPSPGDEYKPDPGLDFSPDDSTTSRPQTTTNAPASTTHGMDSKTDSEGYKPMPGLDFGPDRKSVV